ncbi:MAG: Polyketide cyclase / dehydrase and lipid transport [Actinomycetota bacterium]|jgi:uncharacterized protein YndB with AHSA1/START domain|nr:Polyketide cyclase / dehydrase and lipid transport [Actinomycetota bacterium]
MREFHGTASTHVRASAHDAFDLVTDLDRLPEWNRAIKGIVERPAALTPGAEWVLVMHPPGMPSWKSRSQVEEIEADARFTYRSHSDDRNPSYAQWRWDITPTNEGAQVTVSWHGYPKTFFRKLLAAPLRRRMLEREVSASLETMRGILEHTSAESP